MEYKFLRRRSLPARRHRHLIKEPVPEKRKADPSLRSG
jgi:hypothetical protein